MNFLEIMKMIKNNKKEIKKQKKALNEKIIFFGITLKVGNEKNITNFDEKIFKKTLWKNFVKKIKIFRGWEKKNNAIFYQ